MTKQILDDQVAWTMKDIEQRTEEVLFRHSVQMLKNLGYGRMIQIVKDEWAKTDQARADMETVEPSVPESDDYICIWNG